MFKGASKLNLDAKGRMAMPARYREDIAQACAGQFVVTVDQDRCLLIYPEEVWKKILDKLIELPSADRQVKKLRRLLIGYATDAELDSAGRIRITQELRDFAGIDKAVILIGQGNKFELWDEARWAQGCDEWSDGADEDNEKSEALASLAW